MNFVVHAIDFVQEYEGNASYLIQENGTLSVVDEEGLATFWSPSGWHRVEDLGPTTVKAEVNVQVF